MLRKLMGILLAAAMLVTTASVADAAGKARAPKARKATMEEIIRKAVDEAIKDSVPAASGKFEFLAKRMRPPKNKKWTGRWNQLGQDGWQLVGSNENIYIFQRPGTVDLAAATPAKKADKAAAADDKKAQKEADKAAKTAQKQAEKDAKTAEKAAAKAAKQAAKAAKSGS